MFSYWLQGGRIDVGFLGAAQIDRFANLNSTVVGDYGNPAARLPGAGGAPEIAAFSKEVLITLRHAQRSFVEKLDFVTSGGHFRGGDSRQRMGLSGKGPTAVITDLGILAPDPETKELTLMNLHPGVSIRQAMDATGWPLKAASKIETTAPPTAAELGVLRNLRAGQA
jgi:glutaconate CoA-transferase subunit B